jgi:hypothetical protein
MPAAQHVALALRKQQLLARINTQRSQLAAYGAHLETPLALVDRALQAVQFVKERPWVAGVAALSAVVLGRRKVFRWVGRGWTVWRAVRFAQRWLQQTVVKKTV